MPYIPDLDYKFTDPGLSPVEQLQRQEDRAFWATLGQADRLCAEQDAYVKRLEDRARLIADSLADIQKMIEHDYPVGSDVYLREARTFKVWLSRGTRATVSKFEKDRVRLVILSQTVLIPDTTTHIPVWFNIVTELTQFWTAAKPTTIANRLEDPIL